MSQLANYDAACRALQQAASIDEVLTIRDQAEVMRAYNRQAKNKELELYAQEIRIRAERKLGELIIKQKETFGLAPAGRPKNKSVVADDQLSNSAEKESVVRDDQLNKVPTLAQMGISKDMSSRAQKLASVPEAEFEEHLIEHKQRVAAENARVVNKLETAGEAVIKRKAKAAEPAQPEHTVPDLLAEIEELQDVLTELQDMLKKTSADNESMVRVFDADDKLKAAMAEIARYKSLAENAERMLFGRTNEFNERAKSLQYWQNQAKKFKALYEKEKEKTKAQEAA